MRAVAAVSRRILVQAVCPASVLAVVGSSLAFANSNDVPQSLHNSIIDKNPTIIAEQDYDAVLKDYVSLFETNGIGYRFVGLAEGTLRLVDDGSRMQRTNAWYGHQDIGNGQKNIGFCSINARFFGRFIAGVEAAERNGTQARNKAIEKAEHAVCFEGFVRPMMRATINRYEQEGIAPTSAAAILTAILVVDVSIQAGKDDGRKFLNKMVPALARWQRGEAEIPSFTAYMKKAEAVRMALLVGKKGSYDPKNDPRWAEHRGLGALQSENLLAVNDNQDSPLLRKLVWYVEDDKALQTAMAQ
jgi:hypothetical protein